ncbi:MAG: hypoxanthine phosphoribosyltransferase [Acidimicrobiia bacterium]
MKHTVLFTAARIARQVKDLASAIDDTQADSYLVVTVLKGAAIFSSDLVRAMTTDTELAYITASSYIEGFTPGTTLTVNAEPELAVDGRHVLIVEDIVDTGRTLQHIQTILTDQHAKSVTTVALINKTNRRTTDFGPIHSGFQITNEFIYGYGLDWDQQFRDLPYIAIANPDTTTPRP